ncbi:MAG: RNA polymerase sigma factor [Ignavibacteria bacterium]|jgi:RNA polymerase sigma-70 factor (ECF subfamily)|nr:RNA polymerase sigma factor [Ignavibacteria bacterium]MCU7504433.1 RNA polymerase sigma factor [Ignavibacteria bacterium]MCU7517476.1 RNA polymerase sigma factor [Ignavibacteria bacterium]
MAEDKDFQYVRRFIDGDEMAFNLLVQKYQQKIYWHARRMLGNHMDADEVTQEVLIVLYNKLKSFNFKSSLFTWIYRITATRSINQLNKRKLKRFLFIEDSDYDTLKDSGDIIGEIENKEKVNKLDNILKQLPVKQREVFILRNFDELSYEEIAEITGKSVGGLKANYFHALKKVTEMMGKNENE